MASRPSIATVEDVFDLQGMGKVKDNEKRSKHSSLRAKISCA